jgi:hypothetical protein
MTAAEIRHVRAGEVIPHGYYGPSKGRTNPGFVRNASGMVGYYCSKCERHFYVSGGKLEANCFDCGKTCKAMRRNPACSCRPGVHRDNCPACEGTGRRIDFAAMHRDRKEREGRVPVGMCDWPAYPRTCSLRKGHGGACVPYKRSNPSHPDCVGGDTHYQGKCYTDWNWGVGTMSRQARKVWPRHHAYAIVEPSAIAGRWSWTVKKSGGNFVGEGEAGSANAAKAAAVDFVKIQGWVLGPKRKNPTKVAKEGRAAWGFRVCSRCQGYGWDRMNRPCKPCGGSGQVHKGVMKHGRRPNPGIGLPGMPHTWVTARGERISAGDTIAFRVPAGMGRRGRDWKVVEAKVQRLLVFDDHVVAKYGSSGTVVDDSNFVNLVRKAPRSNPILSVISNPLLSIASNPARRRRRKRR